MKYIAKISIVLLALWMALPTFAQAPKTEVRAFWLSTVWRLTWPQTTLITETGNTQQIQKQKDELTMLLDSVKAANCNTVYFQVRGRCDAMYRSSYEPWSSDLVASLTPDVIRLRNFEKILLEPGQPRTVTLSIPASDLAFVGFDGRWRLEEGDFRIRMGTETLSIRCTETHIYDTPNIR